MSKQSKAKRVPLGPKHPPDSFTRTELLKAIKKVVANRSGHQQPSVSDDSNR